MLAYWLWIFQRICFVHGNDYEACSGNFVTPCLCPFEYKLMSCDTSLIDPQLLFNFTYFPTWISAIRLVSERISEHFPLPPNAFERLNNEVNITELYFKSASIGKVDRRALAGTTLEIFHVSFYSIFQEFSFEALEDVAKTLHTIYIDQSALPEAGRQPLNLRLFPKLNEIFIRNMRDMRSHLNSTLQSSLQISFTNLPSLETLTITHNPNLRQIPSGSLMDLPKLTHIDLSWNSLEEIPPDMSNLHSLRLMNLSYNMISDIDDFNFLSRSFSSLEEVYLYGNDIITVSENAIVILEQLMNLQTFRMDYNPFNCTCALETFAMWLKNTYVDVGLGHFPRKEDLQRDQYVHIPYQYEYVHIPYPYVSVNVDDDEPNAAPPYRCAFPADLQDVSLLILTKMNCTSNDHNDETDPLGFWNPKMIGIIVSIGFLFIIAVGIAFGVKIYRKIGRRKYVGIYPIIDDDDFNVNGEIVHEFGHDAYVSHHDNLIEFVVYNFMPRLEQEPNNFRLFLSFRDFMVGADKLDNVTNAFETCRTTIFLVDNDFVNSNQCMLELKICCSYLLDDARPANAKQQGLILIVMDAIQRDLMPTTLRVLMDKVTYLEWDRLDDEQCWAQLEASLRRIKTPQAV